MELQPKLLRALESRVIRPVGGRTTVHCDLRIVAATNRDLRAEVNRGTFRAASPATLAELTSEDFVAALAAAPWPGNVRELRNHLEQCVVFGERRLPNAPAVPHPASTVDATLPYEVARRGVLDSFERTYVTSLLERTAGNVAAAAREAGLNRTYLYRLLRRHGVR